MTGDPRWDVLRALTMARIGLRRTGASVATTDHLAFQAAHALARDAVHGSLDLDALARDLQAVGLAPLRLECACPDQATHLLRPDLGRVLAPASAAALDTVAGECDAVFLLAGGLSAQAVARHAAPLLAHLLPGLAGWRIGPACLVERGRVALGDEVASPLGAELVVVLIGERPGLSSPDSLGAYLTWNPHAGRTDAERNCLSNIRPDGLRYDEAARRLLWLMRQARSRRLSGIGLKDESDRPALTGEVAAAPALADPATGSGKGVPT